MTTFQTIGFFLSTILVLYATWWGDSFSERLYQKLFNNKFALTYSICSIAYASFGLLINYSVQSACFLTPIVFFITTRLLDIISLKFNGRHFHSVFKHDTLNSDTNFLDIVLTYLILFLTFTTPSVLLNLTINGRMFN